MNKIISFALLATTVMMLAYTTTMNVNAQDEDSEDNSDSVAFTMEKKSSNPSGEKVKEIQSNENSENAAVQIERSQDHSVKQGSAGPSDEPAHTSTRTVERGDTITEITRESAEQSSAAASEVDQSSEIENEAEAENEDN